MMKMSNKKKKIPIDKTKWYRFRYLSEDGNTEELLPFISDSMEHAQEYALGKVSHPTNIIELSEHEDWAAAATIEKPSKK